MHLSLPKRFPLFILASSVCRSLQCLISAVTQRGEGGHLFRLTSSVVLWGGRKTANKYHWRVWGVLTMSRPHWVCPCSRRVCFPVYAAQAPGCSARELSKAGPGLRALPRSKALRLRFSGTPQRRRLGGPAFCALPRSEQLRRPGAWRVHSPQVEGCILSPPVSATRFPGCTVGAPSQVCCVSPLGS